MITNSQNGLTPETQNNKNYPVPYVGQSVINASQSSPRHSNYIHKQIFEYFISTTGPVAVSFIANQLFQEAKTDYICYKAIDEVVLHPREGEILPYDKDRRVDIAIAVEPYYVQDDARRSISESNQAQKQGGDTKKQKKRPRGSAIIEIKDRLEDLESGKSPDIYVGMAELLYLGVPSNLLIPAIKRLYQIPYGKTMGLINVDTGEVVIQAMRQGVLSERFISCMMISQRMFCDFYHRYGPYQTTKSLTSGETFWQLPDNGSFVNSRYWNIVRYAIKQYCIDLHYKLC
jgi:hypothetical protein